MATKTKTAAGDKKPRRSDPFLDLIGILTANAVTVDNMLRTNQRLLEMITRLDQRLRVLEDGKQQP